MSFHGSRSRGQRVRALYPHSTTLGPSRVHAPSYRLGIGGPHPPTHRWYCAAVGYCSGCTMIRTSPPSAAERVAMMCRGEACLEPRSGFTATWYGVMSPRWTATWVITSHLERSLLASSCISTSPVKPWRTSTSITSKIGTLLKIN